MSDADLLIAVTGKIYVAAVDTACPAQTAAALSAPPAPWVSVGNTSVDNLPEWGSNGGSTTTKGTWQNAAARSLTTTATEEVKFVLEEYNNIGLSLYYGTPLTGDAAVAGGFAVNSVRTREYALLIVCNDMNAGTHYVGYWAARCSIGRGDNSKPASDGFSTLTCNATILQSTTTSTPLFKWLSVGGAGGASGIGPSGT